MSTKNAPVNYFDLIQIKSRFDFVFINFLLSFGKAL